MYFLVPSLTLLTVWLACVSATFPLGPHSWACVLAALPASEFLESCVKVLGPDAARNTCWLSRCPLLWHRGASVLGLFLGDKAVTVHTKDDNPFYHHFKLHFICFVLFGFCFWDAWWPATVGTSLKTFALCWLSHLSVMSNWLSCVVTQIGEDETVDLSQ